MSLIKGHIIYSKRKYKYIVETYDITDTMNAYYKVNITNAEGDTRQAYWDFRHQSLEQAVVKYILEQKRNYGM